MRPHVGDESKSAKEQSRATESRQRATSHQPHHSPNQWLRRHSIGQRHVVAVDQNADSEQHSRNQERTTSTNANKSTQKDLQEQQPSTPSYGDAVPQQTYPTDRVCRSYLLNANDETKRTDCIDDRNPASGNGKIANNNNKISPTFSARYGTLRRQHRRQFSPPNRTPRARKLLRNNDNRMLVIAKGEHAFLPWKLLHSWGASV